MILQNNLTLKLKTVFWFLTLLFGALGTLVTPGWGASRRVSAALSSPAVVPSKGTHGRAPETPSLDSVFEAHLFRDGKGKTIPYRLLKPLSSSRGKAPLVLFLHGSGERGNDNRKNLNYIVQIFGETAKRKQYPAFVLVPQCPKGANWVYQESYFGGVTLPPRPTETLGLTITLLKKVLREYPIDPDRIYVMGFSSGGSATWELLERYPHLFAAAAPFCGSGDPDKADQLTNIPIWAFHGALDVVVNPNVTRTMIRAIQKAGGRPRFTEYPGLYHNCWYKTFHNPAFFAWLFGQKRNA